MELATITAILAPMIPSIMDYAKATGGKVVNTITDAVLQTLKDKLAPKIEASDSAKEAATDLAETPDDADLQAVMRIQLKKILEKNPELVAELQAILQQAKPAGSTVYNSQTTGADSHIFNGVSGGTFTFNTKN